MTIEKMKKRVREMITDKRYEHTLGVEYTACCLAYRYGADPIKARTAAVLHDCAKYVPHERMIQECEEAGCPVSESERKNAAILHAKLGAYRAKDVYQIDDEDILSAIACHTTGKPEMNTLDKIIYIADYIEPGRRPLPMLDEIRAVAFQNLDKAMYLILKSTLSYLNDKKSDIDQMTQKTYEYFQQLLDIQ